MLFYFLFCSLERVTSANSAHTVITNCFCPIIQSHQSLKTKGYFQLSDFDPQLREWAKWFGFLTLLSSMCLRINYFFTVSFKALCSLLATSLMSWYSMCQYILWDPQADVFCLFQGRSCKPPLALEQSARSVSQYHLLSLILKHTFMKEPPAFT